MPTHGLLTPASLETPFSNICRKCLGCCCALYEVSMEDDFVVPWFEIKIGQGARTEYNPKGVFNICSMFRGDGCIIYEQRPKICKEFLCDYLKGKTDTHNPFPPLTYP